jgi:hypothetical protein
MREIYLNKTFYLLFDKNVTKSYNSRSIKPPCNNLLHPDNDDFSHLHFLKINLPCFFFRVCDFRQTRTNEIYLGQIFYLLFKLNDKICLYVQINQTRSQQLTTTKLIILMIHIFFASVVDY